MREQGTVRCSRLVPAGSAASRSGWVSPIGSGPAPPTGPTSVPKAGPLGVRGRLRTTTPARPGSCTAAASSDAERSRDGHAIGAPAGVAALRECDAPSRRKQDRREPSCDIAWRPREDVAAPESSRVLAHIWHDLYVPRFARTDDGGQRRMRLQVSRSNGEPVRTAWTGITRGVDAGCAGHPLGWPPPSECRWRRPSHVRTPGFPRDTAAVRS
jgi:hypothetical protein